MKVVDDRVVDTCTCTLGVVQVSGPWVGVGDTTQVLAYASIYSRYKSEVEWVTHDSTHHYHLVPLAPCTSQVKQDGK
jgi:hypothetical protein